MPEANPMVFVVDDDNMVRMSLQRLICSEGFSVTTFDSAQDFLQHTLPDCPACLVLDVRLPDLNGLDLQHELAAAKIHIPIVFITGHGDIPMSVKAMKAGAVGFLTKPFSEQDLMNAINEAIEKDRTARIAQTELNRLRQNYESLTPREREVFAFVVTGMLNKQVAFELKVTEKTIKAHRALVMQKMHANSLADLVRIAEKLKIQQPTTTLNNLKNQPH